MNVKAKILTNISMVKMPRKTHSHLSMKASFHVQHGSSGDCQAIVAQLARMVNRMSGSKREDSTRRMALRLGSLSQGGAERLQC